MLAAAVIALTAVFFGAGPWLVPALIATPILIFAVTYWVSGRLVTRRLALARTLLRQIRRSRFENLEDAHLPRGDELNSIVRQVFRTGQVLQREMAELRRMEDYRRDFIGNVSHELKTPIFAIRGFAETLEGGALEDPAVNRKFVDKILRNADRLDHLVHDLGEISRIEQGELQMRPALFSVGDLAQEILESLEPIASRKDVKVSADIPTRLPNVVGDREHLRQVIVNLMENAIKYNDEGGTVVLEARVTGSSVRISVRDDGIGIPKDLIPRITERFFRVDKSRSRSQGGTGLGLAIVKHILAAHDQILMVESQEGRGSTFSFTLPVGGSQRGTDGSNPG